LLRKKILENHIPNQQNIISVFTTNVLLSGLASTLMVYEFKTMKYKTLIGQIIKLNVFLQKDTTREAISEMPEKPVHIYSDIEIIDGIKRGDPLIVKYIRDKNISFLRTLSGKTRNNHLEEEIFQDALIVVYRKLTSSNFTLNCQFNTYFLAVCKKIWAFGNSYKKITQPLTSEMACISAEEQEEIESLYIVSKEFQLYRRHFKTMKKRQQSILEASINGESYKELFAQFGYASADSFKNEVCRIRKNLINRIISDPEYQRLKNKTKWSL